MNDSPIFDATARVIGYTDMDGNPIEVSPGIYYGDGGYGSSPDQANGGGLYTSNGNGSAGGGLFEGSGFGLFGAQSLHLPCLIPAALRKDPNVCEPATNGLVWLALIAGGVFLYSQYKGRR